MQRSVFARTGAFLRSCLCWDRPFIRWVLIVALPIILQELVGASLHIIDGLMVSSLGDAAYSAVTQANRYTFVLQLFCFGTASGGTIFMSQYWGARDIPRMRHAMGISLAAVTLISLPFMAGAVLMPHTIISWFLPEGESRTIAVTYLAAVAPSYILVAWSTVYSMCIKAGEKTYIPLIAGVVSLCANTVLNYLLIFGQFGFPKLGVLGAAIATDIAAALQLGINLLFAYGKHLPAGATFRQMFSGDRGFVRRFSKVVTPVIFNEGLWSLGVTMYGVYYGHMGDIAVAATGICSTVDNLVWVFLFGMMHATAIIIGKTLGAGRKEEAYLYAKRMIAGAMTAGVVLGVVLILIRTPVLSLFGGLSTEAIEKARVILLFSAITMWFRAYNTINVVGVLRSGGDTVFSLCLDVGSMWIVGVPLCAVATFVLHLPVEYVYLCTFAEEIVKIIIGVPHFIGRKWLNNITEKKGEPVLEAH
ncbi:MAG: MATE family efflux transporter [Eubacteriales bacterium]|nr:MATE family efflux transporter [Eubacteriales bacterium]